MYYIINEPDFKFVLSSTGEFALKIHIAKLQSISDAVTQYIRDSFFIYNNGSFDISIIEEIYPKEVYKDTPTDKLVLESHIFDLFALLQWYIQSTSKKMVIFIGAGVSALSGIPTEKELHNILYINDIDTLCKIAVLYPQLLKARYKRFCTALMTSSPNELHAFIKKIKKQFNAYIVTENMDNLLIQANIEHLNSFRDYDEIIKIIPDLVLFLGVSDPQCRKILEIWHKNASTFYSISYTPPILGKYDCRWVKMDLTVFKKEMEAFLLECRR